jgi:phosphoglycerate transporter family protein
MNPLATVFARLRTQPPAPTIHDGAEIARKYRYWRVRVMYSTTLGYATFYLVRNNMAMATKSITDEFHYSNTQWGGVLSTATIVYAFSKFLSGVVGDRANPRYLLGIALLLSAVINMFFGLGASLGFFTVFWALNNLFQGVGVPPCTRLLTYWYSPREIGRAWGIWNSSHQIGSAVIAVSAGFLVSHYGWRSAFWVPAIVGVIGAFWLMNRLSDSPESMGLPPIEVYKEQVKRPADSPAVPFREIFRKHILGNPGVWIVSVANFFVYVVRIGVVSWAPKYLQEAKGFTLVQASISLAAFEVAGIFGAYASGWLSDTVFRGRRGPVSTTFMLCLFIFTLALFAVPSGQVVAMTALFAALGFFVYGPQMLVAVAAADFATKVASASAVGLTGLFGYLGAAFCGVATGMLVDRYGWNGAIWLYSVSAVIGSILLATTWNRASPLIAQKKHSLVVRTDAEI